MLVLLILILLTIMYFIYKYAFGRDPKREVADDMFPAYRGYGEHKTWFENIIHDIQKVPYQKLSIITRDGVQLFGKYYHAADKAPVVIMFHGYRSTPIRDGLGIFHFCKDEGYNLLMVEQRAHRESGGKTITFGVKERYDCLDWVNHVIAHFGEDTQIILIGLSMGASTVLMASELDLPANVKGIIGDCGYSTPKDILGSTLKKMKLPVGPAYFLVRLSAMLFGGFDPDSASAKAALSKCKIPVLLIHGDADTIVPWEMSRENYEACASEKDLLIVPKAEHAMSYLLNPEEYTRRVKGFLKKYFYV